MESAADWPAEEVDAERGDTSASPLGRGLGGSNRRGAGESAPRVIPGVESRRSNVRGEAGSGRCDISGGITPGT